MLGNRTIPALVVLTFLTGCDQASQNAQVDPESAIRLATQTFREFGDYVMHFNAVSTDQLTAETAREYGIVRGRNRGLLTVSLLRPEEAGLPTAVRGDVSASAVNLTGQYRRLAMREIDEGDAVYYIAEFPVSQRETLIFTIEALPEGEEESFSVRVLKDFVTQ
jgi:hypothetical protein